jgi:hypothetical protein
VVEAKEPLESVPPSLETEHEKEKKRLDEIAFPVARVSGTKYGKTGLRRVGDSLGGVAEPGIGR